MNIRQEWDFFSAQIEAINEIVKEDKIDVEFEEFLNIYNKKLDEHGNINL